MAATGAAGGRASGPETGTAGRRPRDRRLRIERLGPGDLGAIRAHYAALDPAGLCARFRMGFDAEALDRYVAALDFRRMIFLGVRCPHGGALPALAEAHLDHREMPLRADIAVSVLLPWRRAGIGSGLVAAAVRRAFARGAQRASFHFDRDNAAILALVRRLGAHCDMARGIGWLERSRVATACGAPASSAHRGLRAIGGDAVRTTTSAGRD